MIESVRNGVLEAEEACNDPDEDFSSEDRDEINENENNAATGEVKLNYVVKIGMLFEMFSDQLIHMIRNYVHCTYHDFPHKDHTNFKQCNTRSLLVKILQHFSAEFS